MEKSKSTVAISKTEIACGPVSKLPATKICMAVMLKNESKNIRRLIDSVRNEITYYILVDTGSTDNTPELFRKIMEEYKIPGEVYLMEIGEEHINFDESRTRTAQLAYK